MNMLSVDLVGIQADPTAGAAVLVLREQQAPHRLLPIIVGGAEATSIAIAASGQQVGRPLTHDVMATLVDRFDAHVDAAEVTELRDGTFVATLALSGPMGEHRLDARPSDAIALAVRLDAPLLVSEQVLEAAGRLPVIEFDDDEIDAEVDEFSEFLAELDPEDFLVGFPPPTGPPAEPPSEPDDVGGEDPEALR